MNEWLTFRIKDGWLPCKQSNHVWKFQSKFWKTNQLKKNYLKLIEVQACWSLMLTSENNQSLSHTFKPKEKKNFFFFLNILKIFHITIEVYGQMFKVKCSNYKLNQFKLISSWFKPFQLKIRKKNEM